MVPEHRFNLIFWLAMLSSIALYYVVLRLVPPPAPINNPPLPAVLIAVAFALVVVSFLLKSRLAARKPQVGLLVALALCESAALMGVIGWFLTGSPQSHYPLLIGFIGVLLHYPARAGV